MSTREAFKGRAYAGISRILVALPLFAACPVCMAATIEASGGPNVAHAPPWDEGAPRINGPKVYGATTGRAFLYAVPTCGSREGLKFAVSDGRLPTGVVLDEKSGVLSGKVAEPGEYTFEVSAANAIGTARKRFSLVVGDRRALTPPMGWTSWNAFTTDVDQELADLAGNVYDKVVKTGVGSVSANCANKRRLLPTALKNASRRRLASFGASGGRSSRVKFVVSVFARRFLMSRIVQYPYCKMQARMRGYYTNRAGIYKKLCVCL